MRREAGRRINFGTIGCAILWAPFYAVGDLTARVLHALVATSRSTATRGRTSRRSATARPSTGSSRSCSRSRAARRLGLDATASTAAIWFGTPLLFYMYVAPPMAHACSAFTVALLVSIWLRVRTTWSVPGMMALGAVTALTGMVREQDVLLACGPALDCCLWALGIDGGTKPRPGVRRARPARARRARDGRHRVHRRRWPTSR